MGNNSEPAPAIDTSLEAPPKYSETRRIIQVFLSRPLPVIGMVFILILLITAIFQAQLAPYDPYKMDIVHKLQSPSAQHFLGTDSLGRDTLSRVIYGARISLIIAISAIAMGYTIGITLGLTAAYFGGAVYQIIMRIIDALMAFPMLILALMVAALLGGGMRNVIIALGIGMISGPTRLMCAMALSVKENEYILAARATGMSSLRIMFEQILPNAFPPLLVMMTVGLGATILAEAALSFLGIGIVPPTPSWGGMISDGYKYLLSTPALAFSPGIAIMLTVFGFNMMGDGLRDALDPRLRGVV